MPLSPQEMQTAILANLERKTGRGLDAWLAIARSGPSRKPAELTKWLAREHGLGHVTAQIIAARASAEATDYTDQDGLLTALIGPLRDRYASIEAVLLGVSADVERVVCKTYVGFRTTKQFAAVRPVRKELRVAFALPDDALGLPTTRFCGGGRLTHELCVTDARSLALVERAARAAIEAQR